MRIAIVSTGDEVLFGEIVDSNAAAASARLADLGFRVVARFTCGDDLEEVRSTLAVALQNADCVICCGGLGPTRDDRTVEAAARVLGVPLQLDGGSLEQLKAKLEYLGVPLTPSQERQARLPESARAIPNPNGTAPGIEARLDDQILFCLPGPPLEYLAMLESWVLPRLQQERDRRGDSGRYGSRILRLFGRGEGALEDSLGDLEKKVAGLGVGFQACFPEVLLKLRARAGSPQEVESILDAGEALARSLIGEWVIGTGEKSLAATVLDLVSSRGWTLAVAESCTGGLLGKLLTDVPGSSSVFVLSAVTYANRMKEKVLGVPREILERDGAVSAACAKAMAEGVRRLASADIGIAVTGIAGPGGGSADKPVGTVFIAVGDDRGAVVKQRLFPARSRAFTRELAAYTALNIARRRLLGEG